MFTDNSNKLPADRKLLARIFSKVIINPAINWNGTPCWLFTGHLDKKGYGRFNLRRDETTQIHRIVYKIFIWRIPDILVIDHLCRIRNCVNPAHLEPVLGYINTARGDTVTARNAAKTHCKRGHPFDEENTYHWKDGGRRCRACGRVDYNIKDSRFRSKMPMQRRLLHSDNGTA